MVRNDFFAHDSPTGSTPKERIDRAGYFDGASSWAMGETIAWGSGGRATPASIVRSWLTLARASGDPPRRPLPATSASASRSAPRATADGATFTGDFGARG